jgi:hypothetical protein
MTENIVVNMPSTGRRKFAERDRVRGKDEGTASFRGRAGIVVGYVPKSRQYAVEFDDGRKEYPYAHELEKA